MSDISTSLILLVIALVLLWFAVTDKLSRVLDAYDVITGKSTATDNGNASNTVVVNPIKTMTLPHLPVLSLNNQVSV